MRPALDSSSLAVARDDANALVDPRGDILFVAQLQEGDAILLAGCKDALARGLHFRRPGLAGHGAVAEREAEIAGADLGKAEAGHRDDLLAIGDAFRAF